VITPEVDALRLELGLPGMKVLQFGFSNKGAHTHLPHHFTPSTVLHRNPRQRHHARLVGSLRKAEQKAVEALVGPVGESPVWRSFAQPTQASPKSPSFPRRMCLS